VSERCVFLDRDGIINEQIYGDYVRSPKQLRFIPGSLTQIARLTNAGYRVVVISNQQGIGKGLFTLDDLDEVTEAVRQAVSKAGGRIDAFYYCPHLQDDECRCRKPRPGLLLRAAEQLSVNLAETYFVGDSVSDVLAGQAAGCKTILVSADPNPNQTAQPDHIAGSLAEAVAIILGDQTV